MVSVSFGTQFEIALLGLAKITVPMQLPGDVPVPVIACAELAIKASCNIGSGLLAVEARLTSNSFIFTQECRLTGGFAFFVWFAGEHEGDFVVTLGGYHAKFVKPAHYPVVPRLGIRWQLSTVLSITGEAYFALTPSCLMAGGKLDIVFKAGPVSAWFYAHADFLIAWKPLYYDIDVGVRIGVALNLELFTLTVELAAAVHLWGPPFGGIAHVSWYFISFDIPFGDQVPGKPDALTWEQFHQAFLPQSKEGKDPLISTIRITGGLISEKEISVGTERQTLRQVNAHQLSFVTETLIPSTEVIFNETTVLEEPSDLLGIRPMGQTTLDSKLKVTLLDKKRNRVQIDVDLKTVTKNVPCALWSKDTSRLTMSGAAAMTIKAPVGLQVSLKTPEPTHPLAPIDLQKFAYDEIKKPIPWVEIQEPKEIAAYPANEKLGQMEILMKTILRDTVKQKRLAILAALGKTEEEIEAIALAHLAQDAQRIFQAAPEMAGLGEALKPPKSY